ncbi:MAG TPA: ClpXP protease specificity-enhancing factor SspB [Guyparkeria sp.]|nr:ClpXP protease specificity-enhancing factor SspB [Guyparkeria sp.]
MLSKRPYLVPAFYDWIVDQGHVPHLVVNAEADGVMVPAGFVEDGHIQLNIGPSAVRDFHMDRMGISFEARFAGQPERIHVPMYAVRAIIDSQSGQGATFPDEPGEVFPQDGDEIVPVELATKPKSGRPQPQLRAIRGGETDAAAIRTKDRTQGDDSDDDGPDDDPPPSGGPGPGPGKKSGPSLRVVK